MAPRADLIRRAGTCPAARKTQQQNVERMRPGSWREAGPRAVPGKKIGQQLGNRGARPARPENYSTLNFTTSYPQLVFTQKVWVPLGSLCENCTLT